MDQTPSFHAAYDFDHFQAMHLPIPASLHDAHDHSRAQHHHADSPSYRLNKSHAFDAHDNMSFLLPHRDDDHAFMKNWQMPQVHNSFLDMTFDSSFGMDPFQIRSRGGSFNFGRFRKDSEDLFGLGTDIFKHMRTFNDTRNNLENALTKKPVQYTHEQMAYSPKHAMEPMAAFHDNAFAHVNSHFQPNLGFNAHMNFQNNTHNNLYNHHNDYAAQAKAHENDGNGIYATIQNTDTTVATVDSESNVQNKRGRKKRMLNDRSEQTSTGNAEEGNIKTGKPGRPKKIQDNNNTKIEEETSANKDQNKNKATAKRAKLNETGLNLKTETFDAQNDRSTDISSATPKIEDSLNQYKQRNSGYSNGNGSENMSTYMGNYNGFSNVKGNSNYQYNNNSNGWSDSRKIGTLTYAERRVKIEKYLQKRKKRTWSRKINYDCRKRVADSRLRIKGRFVTRDQAFVLMEEANIPFDPVNITNQEIKTLLTEKFGGRVLKKKKLEAAMEAARTANNTLLGDGDEITGLKRPSEVELDAMDLEDEDDEEESTDEMMQ